MQYKIEEILKKMNSWAKEEYEESWDNSGNQIYFKNEDIDKVIVSMDVYDELIDLAVRENIKLIVTHHPFFFNSIKSIDSSTYMGKNIIKAIKNNISIYSAHTTLDISENGVNDLLCKVLELENTSGLYKTEKGYYMGKTGYMKESVELKSLIKYLKVKLDIENIKIYGKKNDVVKKISLCGGAGADFIENVVEDNSNVYITGDIKYHDGQFAYENGITIIDIGHFNSEKLIVNEISNYLKNNFDIEVYSIVKNKFEIMFDEI